MLRPPVGNETGETLIQNTLEYIFSNDRISVINARVYSCRGGGGGCQMCYIFPLRSREQTFSQLELNVHTWSLSNITVVIGSQLHRFHLCLVMSVILRLTKLVLRIYFSSILKPFEKLSVLNNY